MLTKQSLRVLAKDETMKERLATVLYNLVEGISIGANLLEPFMPETSAKVLAQLNAQKRPMDSLDIFGMYKSGTKVVEKPEILFARLMQRKLLKKSKLNLNSLRKKKSQQKNRNTLTLMTSVRLI